MDSRLNFPNQSGFIPRGEYAISYGDTQIIFLGGNGVGFTEPSDDPWFSAHVPHFEPGMNQTFYQFDHLANPMGCVSQVRQ